MITVLPIYKIMITVTFCDKKIAAMIILLVYLFVMGAEGALEGEPCTKGVAGVCTNIRQCRAALEDVTNRKVPQICEYDGIEPIVCCVPSASSSEEPVASASTTTTEEPALSRTKRDQSSNGEEYLDPMRDIKSGPVSPSCTSEPTGRKACEKCLEYQEMLVYPYDINENSNEFSIYVVEGTSSRPDEFPNMALLGFTDESSNLHWECGGSLISENFVLTAAHCTMNRKRWPVTHVQLGTLRRSAMSDFNRYKVKNIIKYPQYKSPSKYNDIALLELDRPVTLDYHTMPACVHTGRPVNDSEAIATGWGYTNCPPSGNTSDVLLKVVLEKFDELQCAVQYPRGTLNLVNGYDDESQMCYGHSTTYKNTCQGDSGGPLQIQITESSYMYTVVGVTSYGDECGFIGEPAIYTRVAHYVDWIENTVWPGQEAPEAPNYFPNNIFEPAGIYEPLLGSSTTENMIDDLFY